MNRNANTNNQPDALTLTQLLRQRTGPGVLIAMLFGALIMYGTSGVIYFSNQILTMQEPLLVRMNKFIVQQNLLSGAAAALLTSLLGPWLSKVCKGVLKRHLLLSGLVVLAWMTLQTVFFLAIGGRELMTDIRNKYPDYTQTDAPWMLYMIGPLIVCNLFYYFQRQGQQIDTKLTEQEFKLIQLEQLKTRAELDALQARINPHFLYNALNSIASLVHDEPDRAERMVLLLSKLFRYTTGVKNQYFNSIENELEMVRTYLDVEQVRFGDRLTYRIDLADDSLKNCPIPQFLLQPLVENAIKHGISKLAGPGGIILRIGREDGWLALCIHDNGPLFPEQLVAGYGLQSIQDKLRLLYGDDARLEVHNQPKKEIRIKIKADRLAEVSSQKVAYAD